MNIFLSTLIKFAKRNIKFRVFFFNHKIVDKINSWIRSNRVPSVTSLRGHKRIFKDPKRNNKYSYDMIRDEISLIKDFNAKTLRELYTMHELTENWEDPDPESEDDIFEEELEVDSKIDFQDTHTYKWHSATVASNLGNIIKIAKDAGDEMEVDGRHEAVEELWLNKEANELAPYNSKASSSKASVLTLYRKAYDA